MGVGEDDGEGGAMRRADAAAVAGDARRDAAACDAAWHRQQPASAQSIDGEGGAARRRGALPLLPRGGVPCF